MINKHWFNERQKGNPVRNIMQIGGTAYIQLRVETEAARNFIIDVYTVYKTTVVFT